MTGDPETDRRPRWQKKRWWAAGLLGLAVAYPASGGPANYLSGRWPSTFRPTVEAAYGRVPPVFEVWGAVNLPYSTHSEAKLLYWRYQLWWYRLGRSARTVSVAPPPGRLFDP